MQRVIIGVISTLFFAAAALGAPPPAECRSALLIEADTGTVLYEHNPNEPLPPASMIKLMTFYVIMKRAAEKSVTLEDTVTVSAAAARIGGSQVYLKQGETFTVKELLEALMIQSANDAAMALAEYVGGSREGFVEQMRSEAQRLSLTSADFHSPHGLPPGRGQEPDRMSAADFGRLSRTLLKEFPETLEYTGISEKPFRGGAFLMRNHNHLLRSYPGCDGLKTGYIAAAGFGVAATAQRNGLRLIAVLMGCPSRLGRDREAARLLSSGFAKFRKLTLAETGHPVGIKITVKNGARRETDLVAASDLSAIVEISDQQIERKVLPCAPPEAPVKRGAPCGMISFLSAGRELGRLDLQFGEDIPRLGVIGRLRRWTGY